MKEALVRLNHRLPDEIPKFVSAWHERRKLQARRSNLDQPLQNRLHSIAVEMLTRLADMETLTYDPDVSVQWGEQVLLVPNENIDETTDVYEIITNFDDLEREHPRMLTEHPITMYGVVFGSDAHARAFFVKRKKMETFGAAGGRFIGIASDTLREVAEPAVIFEPSFDLVVIPEGIAVFEMIAYEKLVRPVKDVESELRNNLMQLAAIVPFSQETLGQLEERGKKGPMLRRRFRSIIERAHLTGVTIAEIQKALKKQGCNPSDYIVGKNLHFAVDRALFILRFLDEGTWRGWRSRTLYATGGRSVVE